MRLVDEKTGRIAYRVCLRLIIISSAGQVVPTPTWQARLRALPAALRQPPQVLWRTAQQSFLAWLRHRQQMRATVVLPQREVLSWLAAAYRQYHTASGGPFSLAASPRDARGGSGRGARRQPGWAREVTHSRHLLSVADLATLWHLPQAQDVAEVPYLTRGRARTLLAPARLSSSQGYRLGVSTHAGQTVPVYLPAECLRRNLLAVRQYRQRQKHALRPSGRGCYAG